MEELGELEANHQQFEDRGARVVVISIEDRDNAKKTQADFPHLKVVADADGNMCRALELTPPEIPPAAALSHRRRSWSTARARSAGSTAARA